jgi:dedicator of cytokinesis protein 1
MNSNDAKFVEKLKNLIADQIPLLDVALSVHKSKAPAAIGPLHERLEECFLKMQLHVESKFGKRTTDLKFEKDTTVILRKGVLTNAHDNRLSETSMGSSE